MRGSRGITLVELMLVMGLSMTVIAVAGRTVVGVMRMDEHEARRETVNLAIQNVMAKIKGDVRAAGSVRGDGGTLVVVGSKGEIVYRNLADGSGMERKTSRGRVTFRNVTGEFGVSPEGINVKLRAKSSDHRRPIRHEISTFIRPRNH